jgi:hypothetical protein
LNSPPVSRLGAGHRPKPARSGLDAGEHDGSVIEAGVRPRNAECGLTSL